METLAIIAIVLICSAVIGLQHLFNYWIRQDVNKTPNPIFGVFGIFLSVVVLGVTICKAIEVFAYLYK